MDFPVVFRYRMEEVEEDSQFNLVTSQDEQLDDSKNSFMEHKCKYCNGKLTLSSADRQRKETEDQGIQLLYGLHDNPGLPISFLCGLQVRKCLQRAHCVYTTSPHRHATS